MITIKVKFRPSMVLGEAGVIYYQITHERKTMQIKTQYRVSSSEWSEKDGKLLLLYDRNHLIQSCIDSDVVLLKKVVFLLKQRGAIYSVKDVVNNYMHSQSRIYFVDYMRKQIEQLRAINRFGTARNYEKALISFSEFLDSVRLPISAMDERVIALYNSFLIRRGLVRNSISFYMRILRATYNNAVRQKLIEQQNPFDRVYTGIDFTRKRAVPESLISKLYHLELSENVSLALCRDMFVFSYCTRGMAFVDIAYLRKSNLQGGNIHYVRRKTSQSLSIKIEPCQIDYSTNETTKY